MKLAAVVLAGTLVAAPAMAYAAVFELDATIGGRPSVLGTVTIADTVVDSGQLALGRACQVANVCITSGPWDQVSFNVQFPALAAAIAGEGNGTLDSLFLRFNNQGQVSFGDFSIESDTFATDTLLLLAHGSGGPVLTGTVTESIRGPEALTLSLVRQIPEPSSAGLLMAGLTVLFGGSAWRKR